MKANHISTAPLCLEPWREDGDELVVAASLDDPQGKRPRLWWRLRVRWREARTAKNLPACDTASTPQP